MVLTGLIKTAILELVLKGGEYWQDRRPIRFNFNFGKGGEITKKHSNQKKIKVYHYRCADCREEFKIPENPCLVDPVRMKYCPYCGSHVDLFYISYK